MLKNPFNRFKFSVGGSGDAGFSSGSATGDSSYSSNAGGGSTSSVPGVSTYGGSSGSSSAPIGSAEWYASEISGREAEARANTISNPTSDSGSTPTTYTDPHTGLNFPSPAIAEREGYGGILTSGGRSDPYAQGLAALTTRAEQERYMARNDDPLAGAGIGARYAGGASVDVSSQYLNRPDIFKPTDARQLTLMSQGLTAGQAAEKLRYDVSTPGQPGYTPTLIDDRYYETLRTQAWTSSTGESAAYHTWAWDTNLPQSANPYEYGADLFTYAEKGYPVRDKEAFSPVDPTILNLQGGKGGQEFMWSGAPYDLRGAMDVVASVQRSGDMGIYGQTRSYSSGFGGELSLGTQQGIAAKAATSQFRNTPEKINNSVWGNETNKGYVTNQMLGTDFKSSTPAWDISEAAQSVGGNNNSLGDFGLSKPFTSVGKSQTTTTAPSEDWWSGIPVIGSFIPSGIFKPTSEIQKEGGYQGFATWLAPTTTTTTKNLGDVTMNRSDIPKSGGLDFNPVFIGADNKPTPKMSFPVGEPFTKDGMEYQNYETTDLSKVSLSRSSTSTTVGNSPAVSWWDNVNKQTSQAMGFDKLPPVTTEQIKQVGVFASIAPGGSFFKANLLNPLTSDYTASYLKGEVEGMREHPADAGSSFGTMFVFSALAKGAGALYAPVRSGMAESAISSRGGRIAMQYSDFLTNKAIPYSLAAMYSTDVAGRSTSGFTDYSPKAAERLGGIVSTEARPMVWGGMAGYSAPGKVYDVAKVSNDNFNLGLKQGTTTGRFDYYVKQPATRPYDLLKQDYKQFQLEGTKQVKTGEIEWAADNRPLSGEKVSPTYRYDKPGVLDYLTERGGLNRAPDPEPTSMQYASPDTPTGIFQAQRAYSKQKTIFDVMGVGKTPKPEINPISRSVTEKGAYLTSEGAYGKQKTIFEVASEASRKGGQVEPYRKFFTEKTSNTLSQKAYPEASEPIGMKMKSYFQENKPFEGVKDNLFYPKQKISDYNKMLELSKEYYPQTSAKGTSAKGSPATGSGGSMTTKTVGGRVTRGLTPEASISKSMRDVGDNTVSQSKSGIGNRADYRNQPRGKEAPYHKMQSSMQLSEQLPRVEGLTTKASPQQSRGSSGVFALQMLAPRGGGVTEMLSAESVQQVRPLQLGQSQRHRQSTGLMFDVVPKVGQVQRQAQEQMFTQSSKRVSREETTMVGLISGQYVGRGNKYDTILSPMSGSSIKSVSAIDSMTRTAQDVGRTQISTPKTTPITTTRQTLWQETITKPKPIITPKPIPIIPPGWNFQPGGGGGAESHRTRSSPYKSIIALESGLFGKKKSQSMGLQMYTILKGSRQIVSGMGKPTARVAPKRRSSPVEAARRRRK